MAVTINASTSAGAVTTADTSGVLQLQTGGTTALTVDASQNVGIGTASPGAKLVVTGSAAGAYGAVIYNTSATGQGLTVRGGSTSSHDAFNVQTYDGGASLLSVQAGGNFAFNSGYGSAAVAYGCRAWVNFNGTGTVAIRASGNVSSITDNGTGSYTVNFTTAMPDTNYATTGIGVDTGTDGPCVALTSGGVATGSVGVSAILPGVAVRDTTIVNVAVFR